MASRCGRIAKTLARSEGCDLITGVTVTFDPLPTDLADAHAMILSLRSETLVRRLDREAEVPHREAAPEQFGQSSERGKLLVEQLELAIADVEESQGEAEAEADIAAPVAAFAAHEHRTRRPPRPVLPADLPVERIVYPAPCACAKCGGARLRKLDEIVSRSLECEPQRWKIVEHVREKMTCRDCDSITEAPAPSHPIPRGFAGPNLLASVLVSKFMLHQPLNRQSDTFDREGVAIDTSTLADRVGACAAALAPLVEAIRRHVLAAERLHADDTTVPVLAKGKTTTGRLWTYVRDDRPFGGTDPPAAAFHYSRSRSGEYPRQHLATYGGIMQADAFAGYTDGVEKPQSSPDCSSFRLRLPGSDHALVGLLGPRHISGFTISDLLDPVVPGRARLAISLRCEVAQEIWTGRLSGVSA